MIESSLPQSEPVLLPGRPSGRQVRSVVGYSLLTALMIVAGIPVFVPAALLHCAIRNGRRAAWTVLVLVILVLSLYGAAVPATAPDTQKMAWSYLGAVALALALPTMAAVPLVERGEKFGRVITFMLVGSVLGFALTELTAQRFLAFSPYAAFVAEAKQTAAQLLQAARASGAQSEAVRTNEQVFAWALQVVPGMLLMHVSVLFILSLLMVGRLNAWRPLTDRGNVTEALGTYRFRNFALPDWFLFAFILGGLTPLAHGMLQKVAANTLAVVVFLYIVQGLAIFRSLLVTVGAGPGGTLIAWMTLLFLFFTGVSQMLLGAAGLFDSFFDFRHFKKRKDDSHESHSD